MYDPNFASWLRYNSDKRCCTDYLRNGSRSFYAASMLLPGMYRIPMTALYAFCRVADDEIDVAKGGYDVLALLHTRLKRIYEGDPRNDPVDRAFSDVAYSYAIPMTIPMALFEGFTWDIDNRDYNTLSDVYAYSARVAGTVGTMMALIMDVKDRELLSRACDLGIAMQLTNIARDVGEDAEQGRLYLPRELLMAEGIDPDAWLRDPQFCPEVGNVVKVLLDAADDMYQRADWGLSRLPSGCRPAMFAARLIYSEIGQVIRKNHYDSVSTRAIVSGKTKLRLLAKAAARAVGKTGVVDAPILKEARFLVDAAAAA